ncbi:MAG: hypothetical protein FWE27_03705 [Defluviitaleaceae bacterium]|nr:hypothetical protein [Defluviitaleaceae bacterium]
MTENMWVLDDEGIPALPTPPEKIVEVQCNLLGKATNYEIRARIDSYSGSITPYEMREVLHDFEESFRDNRFFDIQEDLGEIGSSVFTFEFYVTSSFIPNYKYRIMFMSYSIGYYPLLVVLDDEIASEISQKDSAGKVYQNAQCVNEQQFIELLRKVIGSKKVRKVIASLRHMSANAS